VRNGDHEGRDFVKVALPRGGRVEELELDHVPRVATRARVHRAVSRCQVGKIKKGRENKIK
jgi:hypothetical protein